MYLGLFSFFILGTIVGSFLNVLVLRYGARTLRGRSSCGSCSKTLRWFELIPIASFFLQRGRCRGCKSRISWQYPLVELITGFVFAVVLWKTPPLSSLSIFYIPYSIFHLIIWSLLIAIAVYDLRHKIIPNLFVYSFLTLSFLDFATRYPPVGGLHATPFLDFWSGPLLALPFAAVWFFSRGRAMGLGDAKLMLGFPWLVGLVPALSAVIIGFWLGALLALALLALKAAARAFPTRLAPHLNAQLKGLTMKSELPLGPFLVLGLFIVYLTGADVTGLEQLIAVSL